MTPYELKWQVEHGGGEAYFFNRSTMRMFGDTMKNYGVCNGGIVITNIDELAEVWILHRKKPVKQGRCTATYFDKVTFNQVFVKKFIKCDNCDTCEIRFKCYTERRSK